MRITSICLLAASVAIGGIVAMQSSYNNSPTGRENARRNACIAELRDSLRDPWSLKIHRSSGRSIDYSAKNGFGGYVRNTHYC